MDRARSWARVTNGIAGCAFGRRQRRIRRAEGVRAGLDEVDGRRRPRPAAGEGARRARPEWRRGRAWSARRGGGDARPASSPRTTSTTAGAVSDCPASAARATTLSVVKPRAVPRLRTSTSDARYGRSAREHRGARDGARGRRRGRRRRRGDGRGRRDGDGDGAEVDARDEPPAPVRRRGLDDGSVAREKIARPLLGRTQRDREHGVRERQRVRRGRDNLRRERGRIGVRRWIARRLPGRDRDVVELVPALQPPRLDVEKREQIGEPADVIEPQEPEELEEVIDRHAQQAGERARDGRAASGCPRTARSSELLAGAWGRSRGPPPARGGARGT